MNEAILYGKAIYRRRGKISKGYITDIKPHFQSVSGYNNSGFSRGLWDFVTRLNTGWYAPISHFLSHNPLNSNRDRSLSITGYIAHVTVKDWWIKTDGRITQVTTLLDKTFLCAASLQTQAGNVSEFGEWRKYRFKGVPTLWTSLFRVSEFQRVKTVQTGVNISSPHTDNHTSTVFPPGSH